MNQIFEVVREFALSERGAGAAKALILLVLGLVVSRLASALIVRMTRNRMSGQRVILARRLAFNGLMVLFIASALREAGFDLSVLLGAAGILTVALGFASQTSVSNLISGLFLIGERAFDIGENIAIGDVTGEVLSIDWMSVKIRTFDNLFVRLPNETVLKSRITNLSRFPIRRLDQLLSVAYGSDLDKVKEVLIDVTVQNPLCLDEPKPVLFHKGFGDSAIQLQLSVWHLTTNVVELKNQLPNEIDLAFRKVGIEIPFPQRTITILPTDAVLPADTALPTDTDLPLHEESEAE